MKVDKMIKTIKKMKNKHTYSLDKADMDLKPIHNAQQMDQNGIAPLGFVRFARD
jgi:hypothetical protein